METKKFDLNIDKVLEDWGVSQALREVIANALDEQALTTTKDIEIFKDKQGCWHIRDYGRGLQPHHLTQNEDKEKLRCPDKVMGKFGVGLKDALATFDRNKIGVRINSKYGRITLGKAAKRDFAGITTLHALIGEPPNSEFIGTEFILSGVTDEEISQAKDFFLKFSKETLVETTSYGQVLAKSHGSKGRIYIKGLRVAEEDNFLFSYNITSTNKTIRKALNRERSNVGRTAYADRVRDILLACRGKRVAELLVGDLKHFAAGTLHDELNWLDVQVHACRLLNAAESVVFVTDRELLDAKDMVDHARKDGYAIVTIPEALKKKIRGQEDVKGNPIRDLGEYTSQWNNSFKNRFISEKDLTKSEREVYRKTGAILNLIGGRPSNVSEVRISETMRMESFAYHEAAGVFEPDTRRIIIKRSQLKDLRSYAGTLLHEAAHARSNASDVSPEFEEELTALLGIIAEKSI